MSEWVVDVDKTLGMTFEPVFKRRFSCVAIFLCCCVLPFRGVHFPGQWPAHLCGIGHALGSTALVESSPSVSICCCSSNITLPILTDIKLLSKYKTVSLGCCTCGNSITLFHVFYFCLQVSASCSMPRTPLWCPKRVDLPTRSVECSSTLERPPMTILISVTRRSASRSMLLHVYVVCCDLRVESNLPKVFLCFLLFRQRDATRIVVIRVCPAVVRSGFCHFLLLTFSNQSF